MAIWLHLTPRYTGPSPRKKRVEGKIHHKPRWISCPSLHTSGGSGMAIWLHLTPRYTGPSPRKKRVEGEIPPQATMDFLPLSTSKVRGEGAGG